MDQLNHRDQSTISTVGLADVREGVAYVAANGEGIVLALFVGFVLLAFYSKSPFYTSRRETEQAAVRQRDVLISNYSKLSELVGEQGENIEDIINHLGELQRLVRDESKDSTQELMSELRGLRDKIDLAIMQNNYRQPK